MTEAPNGLSQEAGDLVYAALASALDAVGEGGAMALLSRLTLRLADALADPERVLRLVAEARDAARSASPGQAPPGP